MEVNTDNVAGIEAIDIWLRYYVERYQLECNTACFRAINVLSQSTRRLIADYSASRSPDSPSLAIASEDRDASFFASQYLAHMLALYQNPSKQTLLFEHPESGLHPGALAAVRAP